MTNPIYVTVAKRFPCGAAQVFDAWLDPAKIARWFSPHLGPMIRVETDPRVGGTFSFVQRRGDEDVDHVGAYLEIERPHRLVFTWGIAPEPAESVVTIEIAEIEGGCELTLTHEIPGQWAEYADRTQAGWTKLLDLIEQAV